MAADKAIEIRRNGQGRITEIYPPSELDANTRWLEIRAVPAIVYGYDSLGNLVEVGKLIDRRRWSMRGRDLVILDANFEPSDITLPISKIREV